MSELTEQTLNDLINTLDNICTLHEKQASLEAIDYAIEQARVLLKEINLKVLYLSQDIFLYLIYYNM